MHTKTSVSLIAFILLASVVSVTVILPEMAMGASATHAAITINGDSGFVSENGVVSGSGTAYDPYIIEGWEIDDPSAPGICIMNTVAHFTIRDVCIGFNTNSNDGVVLDKVRNANLDNIEVQSTNHGIHKGIGLTYCDNISIVNASVTNVWVGIDGVYCGNLTIASNDLLKNDYGIYLYGCERVTISNNSASTSTRYGINVVNTSNISLINNSAVGNSVGFVFEYSSNVSFVSNNANSNGEGVSWGICRDTFVSKNSLTNSGPGLIFGSCTNFTITHNLLTHNLDGLQIFNCRQMSIAFNNVSLSGIYGIVLISSLGCSIWSNSFISNARQAYDDRGTENSWDAGYPTGGNAWSDYAGVDKNYGPGQNISGQDGIGDTPYSTYGNGTDYYPLMVRFNTPIDSLVASFTVTPSSGDTNTIFAFDASVSSDFNGSTNSLRFHWNWENDGIWDTAWTMNKMAYHQYSSAGCYAVLLEVNDSNGHFARTIRMITVSNGSPITPPVNTTTNATIGAMIDFEPDTLFLNSSGQWVTVFIELGAPYNVSCINVSSVLLLGRVHASVSPSMVGDEDADGVPDLMVKFDRNETISALNVTSVGSFNRTITVSGSLFNGTSFNGTDAIKVIKLEGEKERMDQNSINLDAKDSAILGIGLIWISIIIAIILLSSFVLRKRRG